MQFYEDVASTPSRIILGRRVFLPEDGSPPFMVGQRARGPVRRPGELRTCLKCGREYFWVKGARPSQAYCSTTCAKDKTQRTKHARSVARGGPKRDTLDKWFSVIVRAAGHCAACGSTERLQCAHILSRRYLGVRFAMDNAVCLCAACHMRFTYRPLEWEEWVIGRIGEAAWRDLRRRALSFKGPIDRQAIAEALYATAQANGLTINGMPAGHTGWTGLTDKGEA
jgi:hypothetical protein